LIFFFFFACSKDEKKMRSEKTSTDSLSYYLKQSHKVSSSEMQKFNAVNKAYTVIASSENTSRNRDTLFNISFRYYNMKKWNNFDEASKLLLKNSQLSNDSLNLAKAYRYRAGYFKNNQVLDSSFYYYLKAEKIYLKQNDKLNYATILLNKGIVQYAASDVLGAELSLIGAYTVFKDSNDKYKLYGVLNQLGLVANFLKEYKKAFDYHNEALKVVRDFKLQNNVEFPETVCLNNIGYLYSKQGEYVKAANYFKLALENKQLINDNPYLYADLVDNLAYSKLRSNNYSNLPQLFFEALELRMDLRETSSIIASKLHLSEYYQQINNLELATEYSNSALAMAKTSKNPADIITALKQASKVDIKNSIAYSNEYIRISDSLQIVERNSKERFARLQLETDDIIQEKDALEEKNRGLLYFFVVSFVLIGFLLIVKAQRTKTRELVMKQAQQKANEDIYSLMISQQTVIEESRNKEKLRIARELHDSILGRMFGARLNLDSLNYNKDDDSIQKRFSYLNELKKIEQDIREISHDLNREKEVLINNFISIVNNLVEEQNTSFSPNLTQNVSQNINWDKINNTVKINLYRILQEGLQNINKYAFAKNIHIELKGDKNHVFLSLTDDGIGFEVNKKNKGIGLQNMISRTHECDGIFEVKSSKGNGTSITVSIPLQKKQQPTEQQPIEQE
jgi:signal transduction histidine kinase